LEIINLENFDKDIFASGVGVALGNFDGIHLGHMELVDLVVKKCNAKGIKSVLYTFHDHPENVIAKKIVTPLINTNEMKAEILSKVRLDYLLFEEFNQVLMNFSPEDFVKKILIDKLNAKLVVISFHYRFGHKGKGDAKLLKQFGKKYGFDVYVVEPVTYDNIIVSSSIIRDLVREGDVVLAAKFLNRPYEIWGTVIRGKNLGTKMGFPTINIDPDERMVLPAKGVYISSVMFNDVSYQSITNVGENPTVGDVGLRIETYILNFSGDLYESNVKIKFMVRIRNERKFANLDELISQITKDVDLAKEYWSSTIY